MDTKLHKRILLFLELDLSAQIYPFFSSLKSLTHLSAHFFCLFAQISLCTLNFVCDVDAIKSIKVQEVH